jgi:hypothetical protein
MKAGALQSLKLSNVRFFGAGSLGHDRDDNGGCDHGGEENEDDQEGMHGRDSSPQEFAN